MPKALGSFLTVLTVSAVLVSSSAAGQEARQPAEGLFAAEAGLAKATRPAAEARPPAEVTTKSFSGKFQPEQLITTGGQVWLVSSGNGNGPGCQVGRLNPVTMALTSYPLSSCGFNVTVAPGALFLETTVANVKAQTYEIHLERFSTSTHVSRVFGTVSAAIFLGSDVAHTQLEYVDGWLWLYAWLPAGAEVLQLSPTTGDVRRTFRSVPQIGGAEPIITGAPGQVWLAGGAGSGADFLRIDVRTGASRVVHLPGKYASVYDLASVGGSLFLLYFIYPSTTASDPVLRSHVGRFNSKGQLLRVSPNEKLGTYLVSLSSKLFSVGPAGSCTPPAFVWKVDEQTLRTSVIARLSPPGGPCAGESVDRAVGASGHSIFVLFVGSPTTLYRVTPLTNR